MCVWTTGVCRAVCRLLTEQINWETVLSFQTRISDGNQRESTAGTVSSEWNWTARLRQHGLSHCLCLSMSVCQIALLVFSCVVYTWVCQVCTLCSEKNTHSHFLSYLHEWCVNLNKNCSEYTQGKVDSDNVEIRYSLRPMTSLWRHICLAKVGASLQHAISRETRISFFWRVQGTCWCTDALVSCIIWWNLRQFNIKKLFIHKPD